MSREKGDSPERTGGRVQGDEGGGRLRSVNKSRVSQVYAFLNGVWHREFSL